MKKLLMILTSHGDLLNGKNGTGLWLGAFADAYRVFSDEGYEVTVASPRGCQPPVDPLSEKEEYITEGVETFREDMIAQMELGNTWRLDEAAEGEYDAVFIADGHGALWDIASNPVVGKILYRCVLNDTPVAMVGHGVAALATLRKLRPQALEGLQLTGFTDTEEALLKRHREILYSLEEQLTETGATFTRGIIPFNPHVMEHGIFITGQNPASSGPAARMLVGRLEPAMA